MIDVELAQRADKTEFNPKTTSGRRRFAIVATVANVAMNLIIMNDV
jgi:hypothetical protein